MYLITPGSDVIADHRVPPAVPYKYLGLAEKVFPLGLGVRSQESGVRSQEEELEAAFE
ncbi:hypothetical protein [Trichormus sp. NMC-1]|uniref:hypothetical protein n=1 Tax=Trichormus sp. NMC-1 TaxID=1853259 RepID=UPI001F2AB6A9|nr:hypothetical protein [Trichormus sp. NMC-1]